MIAPFFIETQKKTGKIFCYYKIKSYFCIAFEKQRALSSAGSEHLVYTQRVGGSNPSAPTKGSQKRLGFLFYVLNFPGATVIFPDNPKGG